MSSGSRLLEDNSKRGARAIFFLKFLYILIIVGLVLANISIELPKHLPPEAAEGMDKETILQLYHAVRRIYYLEIANIILMFGAIVTSVIIAGVFFSLFDIVAIPSHKEPALSYKNDFFSESSYNMHRSFRSYRAYHRCPYLVGYRTATTETT